LPVFPRESGERLYWTRFSCDIDHVSNPEEKLAGVDQALAELGKSDDEISEVRNRFAGAESADLSAVDGELSALSEGVAVQVPSAEASVQTAEARAPEAVDVDWDDESTEVEVIDESDFELLVDEDDLEELEKVGEDDAVKVAPPEIPQEGEEEGDGFFKKLFGGRRSRPPQQ
jgi:hypothetical protein